MGSAHLIRIRRTEHGMWIYLHYPATELRAGSTFKVWVSDREALKFAQRLIEAAKGPPGPDDRRSAEVAGPGGAKFRLPP